jgi:molybdopterin-containing oxidoreductase family iron-sulfur binding subunit
VHDAPAELRFAQALGRVPVSVHAGLHVDETALACAWHLPLRHPLESWGDARAPDGTAAIRQPASVPRVAAARSAEEILALLAGEPGADEAPVRATWPALDDAAWAAALERGVIPDSAPAPREVGLRPGFDPGPPAAPQDGMVAAFAPDPHLWDGRFAPDAWLQELPRPLTKQAWGNAVLLSPADAARLGIADGAEVELTLGGRSLRAAALVLPGHATGAVTLPLGSGRRAAGGVEGGIGFDAYRLRPAAAPWAAEGLAIAAIGSATAVRAGWRHATTRAIPPPRDRRAGRRHPGPAAPALALPRLVLSRPRLGHDRRPRQLHRLQRLLDRLPGGEQHAVVGAEEVARGREMHWLRVDLHASRTGAAPSSPCPACIARRRPARWSARSTPPCTTMRGLNLMVYARCIGTRTCSNNCPYKGAPLQLARAMAARPARCRCATRGPDPPARRDREMHLLPAPHRAPPARRPTGGPRDPRRRVETACQRACPTRAITFGDVNDPESAVSRASGRHANYALLGELGTRPRTTYLARVRGRRRTCMSARAFALRIAAAAAGGFAVAWAAEKLGGAPRAATARPAAGPGRGAPAPSLPTPPPTNPVAAIPLRRRFGWGFTLALAAAGLGVRCSATRSRRCC